MTKPDDMPLNESVLHDGMGFYISEGVFIEWGSNDDFTIDSSFNMHNGINIEYILNEIIQEGFLEPVSYHSHIGGDIYIYTPPSNSDTLPASFGQDSDSHYTYCTDTVTPSHIGGGKYIYTPPSNSDTLPASFGQDSDSHHTYCTDTVTSMPSTSNSAHNHLTPGANAEPSKLKKTTRPSRSSGKSKRQACIFSNCNMACGNTNKRARHHQAHLKGYDFNGKCPVCYKALGNKKLTLILHLSKVHYKMWNPQSQ